jgi:hypothetical protein
MSGGCKKGCTFIISHLADRQHINIVRVLDRWKKTRYLLFSELINFWIKMIP